MTVAFANPFPKLDEARMWSRQFLEHSLFMYLGIQDPIELKNEARVLYNRWTSDIVPKVNAAATAEDAWAILEQPLEELRAFKVKVRDLTLEKGAGAVGHLWTEFQNHIIMELDYFTSLMTGELSDTEHVCTNLKILADHAAFAIHMLGPSETALIEQAETAQKTLSDLHNQCVDDLTQTFLALSENAAAGLDTYLKTSGIGTPRVKSIISPVLAGHVVREGMRALALIQALEKAKAANVTSTTTPQTPPIVFPRPTTPSVPGLGRR